MTSMTISWPVAATQMKVRVSSYMHPQMPFLP